MVALSIVVPCYNEEAVLPETARCLLALLDDLQAKGAVSDRSLVCFVDDGSRDRTWALIEELVAADPRVQGIKLSRNRGHQNALLAGLLTVSGDVVISVDADLQDDLGVIETMLAKYRDGAQIVYGVRAERATDTLFKRGTAEFYYKLLHWMGVDVVPTLGFPSATVTYERQKRFAGASEYTLRKMLSLALDGITSFSALPLRIIAALGLLIFLFSLLLSGWVFWIKFVTGTAIPGWASSVLPIYLLGGIQLLSIGVLGEYIAKIFLETKRRPRFIIEKMTRQAAAE